MQAMRRLTQAPAYKSHRTDPTPDFFTRGTLGTPHHEWMIAAMPPEVCVSRTQWESDGLAALVCVVCI